MAAFHGTFIHALNPEQVEILENTLLVVDQHGTIIHLVSVAADEAQSKLKTLNVLPSTTLDHLDATQFLIPGLIDTHIHAPQWAQRGLGRGLQILDWLDTITFKNEARFADPEHARRIYTQAVRGFLNQGITTASYYGSLHLEATKILAQVCHEAGQRALIGKCNMDQNSPDFYIETSADASLRDTKELIHAVRQIDPEGEFVKPILTPRFAISCTEELLRGLGKIAQEDKTLAIQTHFNEAESEIEATLGLFSSFNNETDLYHEMGLLNERTILAHGCHMTPYEVRRLKELECGIAHCPVANTTVGGGFMAAPIREFLTAGIKVGLGTDSGGGFSISILDAMRQAFIVSNARQLMKGDETLSIDECFYMATLGGAAVCGLSDKVGSFAVGKKFDACLVSTRTAQNIPVGVMTPVEAQDSQRTIFEKFLMSGDDRNITHVWINGRQVKPDPVQQP